MIQTHSFYKRIIGMGIFSLCLGLFVLAPHVARAGYGPLPSQVQKTVTELLAMRDSAAPLPDKADLDAFLEYTTSPINLGGVGEKTPAPEKVGKAAGILWRAKVKAPFSEMLEYLYNPEVPTAVVYPASIRYAKWLPGSDILTLATPLWELAGQQTDAPRVLRGMELEEITPDTNSGAYYKYTLDRVLIPTEFQGQKMLISISVQKGNSEVGRKAAHIGAYENWDFVYSGATGTTAKGIGWADTFIYSSASITVFYEDAPGGKETGYAMYRWMDAGWSSLNMVKQHHIVDGAERSFAGVKAFMESPDRPSASSIASYAKSLENQDLAALRERFSPYSVKVEEAAGADAVLGTDDFQKVIAGAGYGNSMTKDELVAAFMVNFIKEKLGKPLLAGSLNGLEASAGESPEPGIDAAVTPAAAENSAQPDGE